MALITLFRKLLVAIHIIFSVGWLGAVLAFLVLAIGGLNNTEEHSVGAMYISMELIAWWAILPCCITSFGSGIILAFTTDWGLLKHYWIVVKLVITVGATLLLLIHMEPIIYMADVASHKAIDLGEHDGVRVQLIADAGAALAVLIFATIISVYKPWGRIRKNAGTPGKNLWGKSF